MTDPYAPHQHPQGPYAAQPGPTSGPDPYAQQQPGYYGGQPYGATPPPAQQQPQQQTPPATPLHWGEPAAPSTRPWSGPSASAPPAPAAPPPAPQQHVQQQPPAPHQPQQQPPAPQHQPQQQPAAPAVPPAAPPPPEAPATQQPRSSAPDAPTASQPATDPHAGSGDDALTIGRARSNSIVLDDMLVSRQHVRITADDEGLVLEDLGSRNGTYVNGRRVDRTHLHEGDHIGVGSSTFEVRDGWLVNV